MKNRKKKLNIDYSEDYENIMKDTSKFVVINREWQYKGDFFKKYSIYEQYSPVEISESTTLI